MHGVVGVIHHGLHAVPKTGDLHPPNEFNDVGRRSEGSHLVGSPDITVPDTRIIPAAIRGIHVPEERAQRRHGRWRRCRELNLLCRSIHIPVVVEINPGQNFSSSGIGQCQPAARLPNRFDVSQVDDTIRRRKVCLSITVQIRVYFHLDAIAAGIEIRHDDLVVPIDELSISVGVLAQVTKTVDKKALRVSQPFELIHTLFDFREEIGLIDRAFPRRRRPYHRYRG